MKQLIVFDLDGTLAESKSAIDAEMASLIGRLLDVAKVGVISGGDFAQFEKQILSNLPRSGRLDKLSLLPTCGTQFYIFAGQWRRLYFEEFSAAEKSRIIAALRESFDRSGLAAPTHWGDVIQDRGSQVTLSALGQNAPLEVKKAWDPDFAKRKKIKAILEPMIPGFSIQLGGETSIDVTRQGIDKGYGIRKLHEILGIAIADMIFVGDAIFPGGNDYPAKEAGAPSIRVRDPDETKRVIEAVVACLGDAG